MKKLLIFFVLLFSSNLFAAETICEESNGTKHKIESVDGYDDLIIDGTYFYISPNSFENKVMNVTVLDDDKSKGAILIVDKLKHPLENSARSTLILTSPDSESISQCF